MPWHFKPLNKDPWVEKHVKGMILRSWLTGVPRLTGVPHLHVKGKPFIQLLKSEFLTYILLLIVYRCADYNLSDVQDLCLEVNTHQIVFHHCRERCSWRSVNLVRGYSGAAVLLRT